jgi:hypothetical protein
VKPSTATLVHDEDHLRAFAVNILNLKRLAACSADKYAGTAVQTADLETVAGFVRAVAALKKKSAATDISAETLAGGRQKRCANPEVA